MTANRDLIVPAAGRGTRLDPSRPKALVEVAGRPMLDHLLDLYGPVVSRVIVVASPVFADDFSRWAERHPHVSVAEQPVPTGMLDAILAARPAVQRQQAGAVWVTWADQIGVLPATVRRLVEMTAGDPPPALALPIVTRADPYIHFDRDARGTIVALRQRREGDAMPDEGESDMGVFAMTGAAFDGELMAYARETIPGAVTGERNFLPFVPWLAARSTVVTVPCTDPMEAIGINTFADLRQVEAWLRTR